MEIVKINKKALVMDKEERRKLLKCMKYCKMRIEMLGKGIVGRGIDVELKFVEYMIRLLEEEVTYT